MAVLPIRDFRRPMEPKVVLKRPLMPCRSTAVRGVLQVFPVCTFVVGQNRDLSSYSAALMAR